MMIYANFSPHIVVIIFIMQIRYLYTIEAIVHHQIVIRLISHHHYANISDKNSDSENKWRCFHDDGWITSPITIIVHLQSLFSINIF